MRKPPWHFIVLGALLFALHAWWTAPAEVVRPALVVDAAASDAAIDDEVLFREALARELDRDTVVRARLVALGRFLGLGAGANDAVVEREARGLDLQRTDPIVRRHLVEMMRLVAANPSRDDLPNESELRDYYERHAARYAAPASVHLVHVYLSADRRGANSESDAAAILAALRNGEMSPADATALGDPFVRGADLTLSAPRQIDETFGPGFAAALADLPPRTWSGPLHSTYGLHLVWIAERTAGAPPPLEAVRNRVLHQMLDESREARLRDTLRTWRARYDVRASSPAS
jgi:parvulin-like peptidyl-prolyl isomerase